MITIQTISEKYFSVNGVNFAKIYQPLKQGASGIGIYNVNDTRQQLISSTSFEEYQIDGVVYGSANLAVAALLNVVYTARLAVEYEGRLEAVENNQVTGFISVRNKADLPVSGDSSIGYIVLDDQTLNSNNGTWGWNGSVYYKAGDSEAGNAQTTADSALAAAQAAQATANTGVTNAATAQTAAETADGKAEAAQLTADEAKVFAIVF